MCIYIQKIYIMLKYLWLQLKPILLIWVLITGSHQVRSIFFFCWFLRPWLKLSHSATRKSEKNVTSGANATMVKALKALLPFGRSKHQNLKEIDVRPFFGGDCLAKSPFQVTLAQVVLNCPHWYQIDGIFRLECLGTHSNFNAIFTFTKELPIGSVRLLSSKRRYTETWS